MASDQQLQPPLQTEQTSSSTSLMDNLFQRSLEDLIKGLRLKLLGEPSSFISRALEEIRREIKSTDLPTKSTALHKLTYLSELHGVDMSWASFHAVEAVSSPQFHHKRIGYRAITQSFHDQTSVLLLITNQLRKDLNSVNEHEVSLALECLSRVGTHDLARDLSPEVFALLGSSGKSFVRKKAIGVVLKVFDKFPDAVRVCFKRLVENLDHDQILSPVVGVFCELATKDPTSCLPLAPEFFKILVESRNNWVLIKVVKIFAKLVLIEPRLGKKVAEPICEHMRRSFAKSLAFECMRTVVSSLSDHEGAVRLAVGKIREFLLEDDLNLKYLGLHALSIAARKHLWAVLENKEAVVKAMSDDEDINVKLEALGLVMAMVNEDNVSEICRVLMSYALKAEPLFCNEIVFAVLSVCSRNAYEIVFDFDWYVSLLGEMARIPHCQRGEEIEHQLVDIGMRVRDARPELVRVSWALLIDPALLGNLFLHPVLSAASWVSGEYVEFSKNPCALVEALLQPRTDLLPPCIRAVYINSVLKVLVFCLGSYFSAKESKNSYESILKLANVIEMSVRPLLSGACDVEVHERAKNVLGFIGLVKQEKVNVREYDAEACRVTAYMKDVFSEELGPISASAQERVCVPDGLELEENLGDLEEILEPVESDSVSWADKISFSVSKLRIRDQQEASTSLSPESSSSSSLLADHRKRHGMYYLKDSDSNGTGSDYPPANDLASEILMDQKRKEKPPKPRPVVVKLEEGDESRTITSQEKTKRESVNDDESLSRAIQSALLVKNKGKERETCERNSRIEKPQKSEKKKNKKKNGERSSSSKHRSRRRSEVAASSEKLEIPDLLL